MHLEQIGVLVPTTGVLRRIISITVDDCWGKWALLCSFLRQLILLGTLLVDLSLAVKVDGNHHAVDNDDEVVEAEQTNEEDTT